MRAICQLCAYEYAEVSIEGRPAEGVIPAIAPLRYPLTGAMFGSGDPFHGVPAPFDPSLGWEHFRCPMGRIHRPMVCDDLVLTHKGMVRVPKDGGPAFLDPTAKAEVDREYISDRTVMISDEEAERQARAAIVAETPGIPGPKDPSELTSPFTDDKIPATGSFCCPTCGKEFTTEKAMKGHQGGAHRVKKKRK